MDPKDKKRIPSEHEIAEELKARPEVMEYFKQFNPDSIEGFLRNYSMWTRGALQYGEMVERHEKERPLQFYNEAEELFWSIQQKKLFNLQCLWRAEKIEVPGLECTWDFKYWEQYIESCPYIEPITQGEMELFLEFLSSDHFDNDRWNSFGFQDYNTYKEEREHPGEGGAIPDWYLFYDLRMGTSALLSLPDVRGEKEEFYSKLYHESRKEEYALQQKEHEKKMANAEKPKPYLYGGLEELIPFAEKFGIDETIIRYFKLHAKEKEYDYDFVDEAYEFLKTAEEIVSFEPHDDWREQVLLTAAKYKTKKIIETIPAVYENYKMRLQTGIGFPHQIDFTSGNNGEQIDKWGFYFKAKERILKGRVLNGEPADWNF